MAEAKPRPETGWFLTEGGSIIEMDLPLPEGIAQRVLKGAITRVANADGDPYEEPVSPDGTGDLDRVAMYAPPPPSASKAAWVGYAVRHHGLNPDAADGMTKNDLIDLVKKSGRR
ncbi:hypothetical protein GCM10009555_017530 [Acrocarpospora macrocephala]|uniref:Uncharacterized protein n=1 Tax=Acrocarpospora macrocephala TaxID=150177 RepID=A0A5M3WK38_9ACTN|nr:hypothetical protein [Acrocarpospora macrocephala]GES07413.1 hypothetical protein Amac_010080 [Acrocarpospora macrocephala]